MNRFLLLVTLAACAPVPTNKQYIVSQTVTAEEFKVIQEVFADINERSGFTHFTVAKVYQHLKVWETRNEFGREGRVSFEVECTVENSCVTVKQCAAGEDGCENGIKHSAALAYEVPNGDLFFSSLGRIRGICAPWVRGMTKLHQLDDAASQKLQDDNALNLLRITVYHELGHAMGIQHDNNDFIMRENSQCGTAVDEASINAYIVKVATSYGEILPPVAPQADALVAQR